jgi:hypothetical protein
VKVRKNLSEKVSKSRGEKNKSNIERSRIKDKRKSLNKSRQEKGVRRENDIISEII